MTEDTVVELLSIDHIQTAIQILKFLSTMSDVELEISTRAYCKILMHSSKYPSSAITGVLLCKKDALSPSSRSISYTDCIPLFHMDQGLSPMVEVALAQVESQCEGTGLVIGGIYHGHDNLRDTHVDVFTQKIADKIAENQPGSVLITVDSKRLSANIDSPALIAQQNFDGKWKSRNKDSLKLEHDNITLACASALVHKKIYRDLVDFDNHLDDIALDYLNVELNMEIDSCL